MITEIKAFRITGVTPLLQHNPAGMAGHKDKLGRKTIPEPEVEAELGTYRLPDGQLGHPAAAFRAAMLLACKGRRIGKVGARTVMQGGVLNVLDQPLMPLEDPDSGEPLRDYVIDIRRCVVQGNGVMRARPRNDRWAGTLLLEIDPDVMPPSRMDLLLDLLDIAGHTVGVGELRPRPPKGSGGPLGRFTAVAIDLPEDAA